MLLGKVRSFKDTWGFLRSDSVSGDIFVGLRENPHLTTLAEGNTVLFDVRKDVRGKNEAVNVQPLLQVLEPAVPSRHSGWVRSFTGSWGFINSPSFSGDLFVGLRNNPQLSAALAAGDQVEFSIRQIDNKTEAIDVHVLGHGGHGPVIPAHRPGSSDGANAAEKGAQVRHLVGQRLEGSVRSFRDSWGCVVSEAFQGDLYLHRRNNSELGPVQAGDPVSFQVLEDPPGHFQAVGCQVLPVPLAQLTGQRLFGWVKSFYPEDWGFLASLRFEGELFVSLDKNPRLKTPLKSGESVVFNIQQDEETGELHAVDVARSNSTVQKDTKEGQTCIGKVKSFRGEWGFITSDSLEGDVFLHLRDNPGLPPLSPGETVEFTVGGSERLHAENVRLLRRTSPLSELLGQICSGTVRKFSGEWGFITSPHFDGDVFVGLRSNRHLGGPLVTGDIVEFRITRDVSKEKDTFEASNVRILSPATHATTSPVLPVLPVPVPSRSRSPRKAREMATLVGKKLTGTVRSFRGDWGFVISESFAGDLFVGTRSNGHLSTSLKEGDMISFRVEIGSGKAEAVNVELI